MSGIKRNNLIITILIIMLATGIVTMIFWLGSRRKPKEGIKDIQNKTRITISWWGNDDRHLYTMEGVDMFQEKNPDIDVSYRYGVWSGYEKRNKVWMESHNEADVMQINFAWLQEYSPDGKGFYDLNKLSDYINLDNFSEEQKKYGEKNGTLNALPIAMNTHTFYYNQDILDEYGVGVPQNWDDLFALGKLAKKEGKYALGCSKKQLLLILVAYYEQTYGKKVFGEDGRLEIDEDGIRFMFKYYKQLINENVLCPIDSFDRSKYMSGEIIGTMCWISDTKIYYDVPSEAGVNVSRGPYPVIKNAKDSGWYIKPATMWAISADTQHPEEAAKLLDFLLNDPDMARLQKTEKGVPVSSAAIEALSTEGLKDTEEYKATQEMIENQDELHMMIPNMENEDLIDIFKSGADEYLYDKESLEDAAKDTYKAMIKYENR